MPSSTLPARVDVLVIGSGFSGLCVAIHLKKAGFHDFILLEQAPQIGGTWRDNHYPGAACDIPSHLYSFSFEPNPRWSRMYPEQAEIQDYVLHCASHYGLLPHIHCNQGVAALRFDEALALWHVTTRGGQEVLARAVVSGTGGLSRPAMPAIPGLDQFAGALFHSARWDHGVPLAGKTVAVVGTGASAIQFVPHIAQQVGRLLLFQRTPPWVLPKPDRPLGDSERRAFRRFPLLQRLARLAIYWQHEIRAVGFTRWPGLLRKAQTSVLRYLAYKISDPVLRDQLTPRYTLGCKRILLSSHFYPALAQPHVQLYTRPITHASADGLHTADGVAHPVDVIILGTGFQVADAGLPFSVQGQRGTLLETAWRDGASAYLGSTVAGFPNLFLMTGPNTALSHNSMIFMIEAQTRYVLQALKGMRARGVHAVVVRPAVQQRFNAALQQRMEPTVWSTGGCRSWYLNRQGRNTTLWPGFTFAFRWQTRRFDWASYDTLDAPA